FFSSRRRHTRSKRDWSSDVCSSDLQDMFLMTTLAKIDTIQYRSFARWLPILVLVTLLSGCGINSIPKDNQAVKAAWAQVQNEYQRRADLIPNLVATVKAYAKHERETLTAVTKARA